MFDFLNRLFGRQSEPQEQQAADPSIMGVRLYWREHDPITYEARIFTDLAAGGALRADLPKQLLRSELTWFWESGRYSDENPPINASLPRRRQLAELTDENAPALLADLQEHTAGSPRWFALFGGDPELRDALRTPAGRKATLEKFSAHEEGPLRVVIYQEGGPDWEMAFVSHDPPEDARRLLASWGVEKSAAIRTFEDRETNGIFEATFELPQRPQ